MRMNYTINWDFERCSLTVVFIYPLISNVCIDKVNNVWKSNHKIVQDILNIELNETDIQWKHGGSGSTGKYPLMYHLELGFRDYHKISFVDLNNLLTRINSKIINELDDLIK